MNDQNTVAQSYCFNHSQRQVEMPAFPFHSVCFRFELHGLNPFKYWQFIRRAAGTKPRISLPLFAVLARVAI